MQVPIGLGVNNQPCSYQNENYTGVEVEGRRIRDCIEAREALKKHNYLRLLASIVLCYGNFCVGSTYSVLGPLFPSEIRHLSPSVEGIIFIVQGAFYAMFNPYWASLVDKVANKHNLCIAGCIFSLLAYVITGPLPFIPINPNLWLVIIGQVFLGFSMGGMIVGSFAHGFQQIL
ncbi:unnamed protein product [Medioppia subpectinata]|uniref:Major facilitator superfamily (MFS) profile domain-containing protein n=1 Tax=Medioppia subpectinata TaxID=1979941 RepID=A0A7R9KUW5_9ACAR|nr:unnamed protein product [Medioppia subpectinata]CAG2109105.1 unnamed protein product [Medioppia subpectinata]